MINAQIVVLRAPTSESISIQQQKIALVSQVIRKRELPKFVRVSFQVRISMISLINQSTF
jgi:hypothetical protein